MTHSEDMMGNIRGVPSINSPISYGIADMLRSDGNIVNHKLTGSMPELYVPCCVIAKMDFHFKVVVMFL